MTAPKRKAKAPPKKRTRIDWEAVERDYRTAKFTQTELADKHHLDPATLSRQIKKDRALDQARWQQDLTEAVRQATNAALMTRMVNSEIKEGQEKVNSAVKVAAEVNTQVILRHRGDILAARDVAAKLLTAVGKSKASLTSRVSSTKALAETITKLQAAERVAFKLDEAQGEDNPLQALLKQIAGKTAPIVAQDPDYR